MNGAGGRQNVTLNAAYAVAASLTRLGLEYILVSDMAAKLLKITNKVPKDVKFVIMTTAEETIPIGYVELFLVAEAAFDIHRWKDGRLFLRYFDSIIQPPKKNWCDVELATISNALPAEYTTGHVVQINGLRVASEPSFAVEKFRTVLSPSRWRFQKSTSPFGSPVNPSELVLEADVDDGKPPGEVGPINTPTDASRQRLPIPTTIPFRNRVYYQTEVLCLIAKKVVDFLHQIGMGCALFGSLACYLYGNKRAPNDIDMIVFPDSEGKAVDAEKIKRDIAAYDPVHFRLETPKDPTATYRVLYFLIDQGLAPNKTFPKNRCKVDVLVPGILHLPFLTGNNIKWHGGLPVVPFPVLLLQKLQGWDDHMRMKEEYKFKKHETDAADIQALLKLEHVVSLRFSQPWDNVTLFSREFMELSRERITDFCIFYRESAVDWSLLGFDIHYYAESL